MADADPISADMLKMDAGALNAFLRDAFPHSRDGTRGNVILAEPGHIRMHLATNDSHLRPGGIVSGPTQMALTDSAAYVLVLAHIGPVAMAVGGTRQKLSMIATVTNQGKTRWMIIDEAFDADKLIEFLQALIKDAGKKVFLILDNLRVHHSKLVKAWVALHEAQIELFYLPSYSPQLNPEERLNADLKQEMGKRVPVRTKARLREAANDHMAMLEQNPQRVMSYFQDRRVRYAA